MKWLAVACALGVALCWGMYGPTLSHARAPKGEWGPFKPYLFIGIAYLVIAVIGGAMMMKLAFNDNFDYSGVYRPAMNYGFLAGCLGAFGALFLTFALTKAGGKPAYVMPIVFGGAVSVNAIAAFLSLKSGEAVNPLMWIGMGLVAVGIILTARHTPHGHPPARPAPAASEQVTAPAASSATTTAATLPDPSDDQAS
ncbi:MAG: hypothetical protein ISQ09_11010 [Rubripirellula sp.]|jgi:drug/metabolite transporter (DMT)-like permease|nr:hypothetical protein [Rubripirellula sp.]MDA9778991.1 hypothetical protein [Rubripirellula sp.]